MFGLRLIDNARRDLHRFWVNRISIAYAVFAGISAVIAAFVDILNPWVLVVISILVTGAMIPLSRMVKQAEPKTAEPPPLPAPSPEPIA